MNIADYLRSQNLGESPAQYDPTLSDPKPRSYPETVGVTAQFTYDHSANAVMTLQEYKRRQEAAAQQQAQQSGAIGAIKGLRDDKQKLGFHLLPSLALEEVAKVLDYGKNKYSRDGYDATDNWRKGLFWRATVGSLLRHSFAFLRGEDRDPESGLYHMAHVGANALFLLHFLITNGGTDDRFKETRDTKEITQEEYKYIND